MKKIAWAARVVIALLGVAGLARAVETTWIYSVQLSAAVQASPPRIELSWPADHLPVASYTIFRKAPHELAWPAEGTTIGGESTSFTDENVADGQSYEYQVIKRGVGYTGYGYLRAALNAPLVDARGRVILLADDTVAGPLGNELALFEQDLVGDGWVVARRNVARDASPASVRDLIKAEYESDRANTKALILFGHVPVVRAGNLNVDGHRARPMPADVFYGEMDGTWTDANQDGVYDQSLLPSDVELQVGRIDFADLPGQFASAPYPGEIDLLRRYLEKNHAYRLARVRPALRGLIGGVGDANGQAYSAAAYRNFAATVGASNVTTIVGDDSTHDGDRWVSRLARDDFLFVHGQGAGSDFTVGNLGTHGQYHDVWSSDFLERNVRGTFYFMFGSWFSDWAQSDNILRSLLAAPDYGLGAAWSGRPHLFLHAMGSGETIGHGIRLSQNNDGTLYRNQVQRQLRGIHIALLGDPTLRLYAVAPPTELNVGNTGSDVALEWRASRDEVLGYHVYRSAGSGGPFARLTESPVRDTRFTDPGRAGEGATYQVKAIVRQTSPSGAYFNASQAAFGSASGAAPASVPSTPPPAPTPAPAPNRGPVETVWVDDGLPAGAAGFATANDRWNWVPGEPAPASGSLAHLSDHAPGLHFHFFVGASSPMTVGAGDTLFAYVFIDPSNPPRSLALSWCADNSWEHRAYWGEDLFTEGANGSASRQRVGPIPSGSGWQRIEVPASAVGLEGRQVIGMGFMLYDGRVSWDKIGKVSR